MHSIGTLDGEADRFFPLSLSIPIKLLCCMASRSFLPGLNFQFKEMGAGKDDAQIRSCVFLYLFM